MPRRAKSSCLNMCSYVSLLRILCLQLLLKRHRCAVYKLYADFLSTKRISLGQILVSKLPIISRELVKTGRGTLSSEWIWLNSLKRYGNYVIRYLALRFLIELLKLLTTPGRRTCPTGPLGSLGALHRSPGCSGMSLMTLKSYAWLMDSISSSANGALIPNAHI